MGKKLEEYSFRDYSLKQQMLIVCSTLYLFTLMVFVESGDTLIYSKIAFIVTFLACLINISNVFLTTQDICIFAFSVVCMASVLWSPLPVKSEEMGLTLMQLFLMFVVFRMGFRSFGNEKLFVRIITFAGLGMCLYYLAFYGISGYISALRGTLRLGSEFENTNTIGGAAAFVFALLLYRGYKEKKFWYFVSVIPAIVMLGAGSRTAILVSIGGVLVILINYIFTSKDNQALKKAIIIVLVIFGIYYLITHISQIGFLHSTYEHFKQMFDVLSGKSNLVGSTSYRMGMLKVGWQLFLSHPIVGNGINATANALHADGIPYTVLHDNFIELLADVGLVGFLSYYSVYFWCIKLAFKQVKSDKLFPLMMLVMMLIIDIGGVTYYMQRNYLFLIFVTVALENDWKIGAYEKTKKFVFGRRY